MVANDFRLYPWIELSILNVFQVLWYANEPM